MHDLQHVAFRPTRLDAQQGCLWPQCRPEMKSGPTSHAGNKHLSDYIYVMGSAGERIGSLINQLCTQYQSRMFELSGSASGRAAQQLRDGCARSVQRP